VKRPSKLLLALELRAVPEFAAFAATALPLLATMPQELKQGNGSPVLVFPGFLANDAATLALRWFLGQLGYQTYGWGQGINLGPTDDALNGIRGLLRDVHEAHDEKVAIVGWSLGGIYAREQARSYPDRIRQVISLASPFQMAGTETSSAHPIANRVKESFSADIAYPRVPDHLRPAITLPTTAVFTRSDGVVPWEQCVDTPSEMHQNVEVLGSHSGMVHNPAALWVIADRLAQSEDTWEPFEPPGRFDTFFPEASHVAPALAQSDAR